MDDNTLSAIAIVTVFGSLTLMICVPFLVMYLLEKPGRRTRR